MTMLRFASALALIALAAPALAAMPKGDPVAGAEKAKTCASCHGATGNESLDDTYPKLAGQYPEYLAKSLRDYKSGERKNAIMAGFAAEIVPDAEGVHERGAEREPLHPPSGMP